MADVVNGWSTTKTVLSLAALMLVDRGELDVNAPVADYWPEFAAEVIPYVPDGRTFYWGGWGGLLIVVDLDRGLTISYLMNRTAPGILGSDRAESCVRAVYDAAG